jgi:hypothetical protein
MVTLRASSYSIVVHMCSLFSRWEVPLAADRGAAGAQLGVQRSVPVVPVPDNASSDSSGSRQLAGQRAHHRSAIIIICMNFVDLVL